MINTELSSITAKSKLNPPPELSTQFRDIGIRAVAAAVRYQCTSVCTTASERQADASQGR
jgi:hypothetical protein